MLTEYMCRGTELSKLRGCQNISFILFCRRKKIDKRKAYGGLSVAASGLRKCWEHYLSCSFSREESNEQRALYPMWSFGQCRRIPFSVSFLCKRTVRPSPRPGGRRGGAGGQRGGAGRGREGPSKRRLRKRICRGGYSELTATASYGSRSYFKGSMSARENKRAFTICHSRARHADAGTSEQPARRHDGKKEKQLRQFWLANTKLSPQTCERPQTVYRRVSLFFDSRGDFSTQRKTYEMFLLKIKNVLTIFFRCR